MAAQPVQSIAAGRRSVLPSFVRVIAEATRWKLAAAVALMAGVGLTAGTTVLLLVPLLAAAGLPLTQSSSTAAHAFGWIRAANGPSLVLSLLTLVLVTAAQGALNLLQLRLAVAINHDVVAGLRRQLFDRMCRADWARYTGFRMSDLLEALTAQADRVGYAARSVLVLGSSVVTVAVYVAIAAAVSTSMTAVSVLTGGLLMALLGRPRRASAQAGEEQAMLSKRLYASASDTLLSMKTIRAHGAERRHALELIAIGERERELGLRLAGAHGAGRLGFDVAAVGLLGLVTFLGLRAFAVPPAELLLILFVFVRLAPQLSSLQQACQNVAADLPAFESLMATLQSCEAAAEPRADDEPVSFNHHIRVDHAGFAYGDAPVLTDVTLAIPAGSTVAIVGPSGAGKSTLADLVLGLVTPQSGRVMVDGVPLTPGRMSAWRAQVGYVPQDTSLVHDTVRANLLCAAPHARPEEIWAALKTAAAAGFVGDLPRGLETVVGDRGVLLSGGERQRLGLARALLRRPRLLILDEATSSLDSENERVIEQAVSSLHGRVAILLITHRLSAVRRAEIIYVLDEGRVVESGRWDELMAAGGRFQALCRAQGIYPSAGSAPALAWEEGISHAY